MVPAQMLVAVARLVLQGRARLAAILLQMAAEEVVARTTALWARTHLPTMAQTVAMALVLAARVARLAPPMALRAVLAQAAAGAIVMQALSLAMAVMAVMIMIMVGAGAQVAAAVQEMAV